MGPTSKGRGGKRGKGGERRREESGKGGREWEGRRKEKREGRGREGVGEGRGLEPPSHMSGYGADIHRWERADLRSLLRVVHIADEMQNNFSDDNPNCKLISHIAYCTANFSHVGELVN